jgi:NAD(P)H-dependent FMN reductase
MTDPAGARIAVIVSSTRPSRICPGIAEWTARVLAQGSPLRYELVDLAEIGLPQLDEPLMAALKRYAHPHTVAWSELVSGFAGFVFVVPQYNWGYPGVLKDALDFLYAEWHGKPVSTVTYGTRGGNRAANQLSEVFQGLHMRPLESRVELKITEQDVDDEWQLIDLEAVMAPSRDQLRAIDDAMAEALLDDQL